MKCIECGLCREVCPVYRVVLKENVSPRGKHVIVRKRLKDKAVFFCTSCGNCAKACPWGINLPSIFREYRKELAKEFVEFDIIENVIKNIRRTGNAFGL